MNNIYKILFWILFHQETESKKQQLHKANMRKLKLRAEVEYYIFPLFHWIHYFSWFLADI